LINEGESSPTRDVILLDNVLDEIKVIIEISSTTGFNKDFNKIIELIDEFEVEEGFVNDYKKVNWRKYKLGVGEIVKNSSFCYAISYVLKDFVK